MKNLTGLVSLAQALDQALAATRRAPTALAFTPRTASTSQPPPRPQKKLLLTSRCPWCGLQILQTLLRDHLEIACAYRGRFAWQGAIPLNPYPHRGGCRMCGAPVAPGENYCYTCIGD